MDNLFYQCIKLLIPRNTSLTKYYIPYSINQLSDIDRRFQKGPVTLKEVKDTPGCSVLQENVTEPVIKDGHTVTANIKGICKDILFKLIYKIY
jgi:hypothetical protein